MTDAELAAIEARVAAATPEPWEERGGHVGSWHRYKSGVRDMIHFVALASVSIPKRNRQLRPAHEGIGEMSANSAFIAHARQDVPALVAEVRRLRAELEAARNGEVTAREPIPTNAPDLLAALVDLTQLVSSGYPRDDIAMQRSLRDACAAIRVALGETAERPLARDLRAVAAGTKSRSAINQHDPEIARWRAQANHYEQHMLHGTVCAHDLASVWNGIRHDDPDDQSWCDGSGTRLCGNPDCAFDAAFSGLAGSTVPTCPECGFTGRSKCDGCPNCRKAKDGGSL